MNLWEKVIVIVAFYFSTHYYHRSDDDDGYGREHKWKFFISISLEFFILLMQ